MESNRLQRYFKHDYTIRDLVKIISDIPLTKIEEIVNERTKNSAFQTVKKCSHSFNALGVLGSVQSS